MRLGVTRAAVERVRVAIQAAGPPGFAARSLRECLLLQIEGCGGVHRGVAYRIVADHLNDLGAGRFGKIARAPTGSRDKPREDVVLQRVELFRSESVPAWPGRTHVCQTRGR